MPLDFVNVNGDPWVPSAAATQPKKRGPVVDPTKPACESLGWEVSGFTAARVEMARKDHHAQSKSREATGRDPLPPFDAERWMEAAMPQRINVLQIESSANECAALARRMGWLHVEVRELIRGNKETAAKLRGAFSG